MISNIKFSRIGHPRATFWGIALLIGVFLGFGLWTELCMPEQGLTQASAEQTQSNKTTAPYASADASSPTWLASAVEKITDR